MLSTVVNRLVVVASVVFALGWTSAAFAVKAETEASVVARLYKDFAWQAIASQPELFGDDLAHQSKATLEKYFTPALAELLVQDAACQVKESGICNLDFDILFDSQDPTVADLDVKTLAPGKVSVEFKNPVSGEPTKIEFKVAQVGGKWKITDVNYSKNGELSLKKILSRRSP